MVLVILGLIAAAISPQIIGRLDSSKVRAARLQLDVVLSSLDAFFVDVGRYPTVDEGVNALLAAPPNAPGWAGPYARSARQRHGPVGPAADLRDRRCRRRQRQDTGADGKAGGTGTAADLGRARQPATATAGILDVVARGRGRSAPRPPAELKRQRVKRARSVAESSKVNLLRVLNQMGELSDQAFAEILSTMSGLPIVDLILDPRGRRGHAGLSVSFMRAHRCCRSGYAEDRIDLAFVNTLDEQSHGGARFVLGDKLGRSLIILADDWKQAFTALLRCPAQPR